jgi:esterase/lipase superfamily enzyme
MQELWSWMAGNAGAVALGIGIVAVCAIAFVAHRYLPKARTGIREARRDPMSGRGDGIDFDEKKPPDLRQFRKRFERFELKRLRSRHEPLDIPPGDKWVRDLSVAQDRQSVGLLLATTRNWEADGTLGFARSPALGFGSAAVRVPEDHRIGRVERPWELRVFGWTLYRRPEIEDKHFKLQSLKRLNRGEFVGAVQSGREGLLFVHGFNNTVEDAVFRLAQIVWDTQFTGVPILFSWPSRADVLSYLYDRESAVFSVDGFVELLTLIERETKLSTLHIIAHSMGNQIVTEALARLGRQPPQRKLGEIILAAPDVDWDVFKGRAPSFKDLSRGVTLYASSADKALVVSRSLAKGPRAGDVLADGPLTAANLDTIDVTAVGEEMFGLNHNTFAAQRSLIDDIGRLILKGDRPPHQRSPQIRGMPIGTSPPRYWRYAE